MPDKKYCWINLHTGEISNSWDNTLYNPNAMTPDLLAIARDKGMVYIEYKCLNDDSFEFYPQMKLK